MIPGWPYSFVAALGPGASSWTALLDAVRLGPDDDPAEVTAAQLCPVTGRLAHGAVGAPGRRLWPLGGGGAVVLPCWRRVSWTRRASGAPMRW